MFITLPLALIGVGYFVYLLFSAATYALPLLAALGAGFAAAHAGASGTAALLLGVAVFMAVIAAGRIATALLPSRHARAAVVLAFALPAAIIGFEVASALLHFSEIGDMWHRRRGDCRPRNGSGGRATAYDPVGLTLGSEFSAVWLQAGRTPRSGFRPDSALPICITAQGLRRSKLTRPLSFNHVNMSAGCARAGSARSVAPRFLDPTTASRLAASPSRRDRR